MENGSPSETATLAALLRAAHPLVNAQPWIFEDEFAAPFSGLSGEDSPYAALERYIERFSGKQQSSVVEEWIRYCGAGCAWRARFSEDALYQAISRGTSQYVILGSGLDSFAYRRRDLGNVLRVFEVDYPATQERKRRRLRDLDIDIPEHVTFVPIDFEKHLLSEALYGTGFRCDQPAFFSWMGVAAYLTEASFLHNLQQIASASTRSEIVLDYVVPNRMVDAHERKLRALTESLTSATGERMCTYFEPNQVAGLLTASGFGHVEDLPGATANMQHFAERVDGLRVPNELHLSRARKG
jgi:methyltransferase (TIGR00027 family)